jgi:hypothetical protein
MDALSHILHIHHNDNQHTENHIAVRNVQTQQSLDEASPQKPVQGLVKNLHFGVSRVQGAREYQEDEYACVDNLSANKGPSYFAVFDGHGGDTFAAHSSANVHNLIFENEYPCLHYSVCLQKVYYFI